MKKKWIKNCPKCGKEQCYTLKNNFSKALKNNLLCLKCSHNTSKYKENKNLNARKMGTKNFIFLSNKKHNFTYNYSKTKYDKNQKNKVCIICSKHGEFWQSPTRHLTGDGCPTCAGVTPLTIEKVVHKSNITHNNKYNYIKSIYGGNNKTKIEIICKKHGSFWQSPNHHMRGRGCPKCAYETLSNITSSKLEIEFLDYIRISFNNRSLFIKGYIVDGYDPDTKTIYEFLGDYWHGNPNIINSKKYNKLAKNTFEELYKKTFKRFYHLKNHGYNIKYIWENDWKKFKKKIDNEPKILTYE